jgi:nuclear transcription factor Y gamma
VLICLLKNTASASPPNTSAAQTPVLIQTGQAIAQSQPGNVQIVQQIVTPSGEIQQIPVRNCWVGLNLLIDLEIFQINLTPQQLQMIKMQLQGNTSQPVIIQTTPIATSQPHLIQVI